MGHPGGLGGRFLAQTNTEVVRNHIIKAILE